MKKKILILSAITLIICICVDFIVDEKTKSYFNNIYLHHKLESKSCSEEEKRIGEEVRKKFERIVDYSGEKEDASWIEEMGPLNLYYYFTYEDVIRQDVKIKFVTAEINDDKGKLWYDIERKCYKRSGDGEIEEIEEMTVKGIIMCDVRKINNKWSVINDGGIE